MFLKSVCIITVCLSSLYGSTIKHPDGFMTLRDYPELDGVKYLLCESNSKQFTLSLKNGVIVDEGGIVTKEGKIFKDTETYREDQHRLLRNKRDISKETSIFFPGKLVVISSPGQENWYHWLFQVLPRIKILVESGLQYDKIYINNLEHKWQKESLHTVMKLYDLTDECLFLTSGDSIVQASELIVPSIPFAPSKSPGFPSWLKKFIRTTFLVKEETNDYPERIYISRSKAKMRRIKNEDELIQYLKQKDFVILNLEELPIHKQAAYFYNAKTIIGPHGSGFSNLIFSNPKTSVLEIDHGLIGDDQRSFYKRMAEIMDCQYFGYYPDLVEEEFLEDDIVVDIQDFSIFLEKKRMKEVKMNHQISVRNYQTEDVGALAAIYYNTIHRINSQHYTEEQLDVWAPKSSLETEGWAKKFSRTNPMIALVGETIVGFAEFEPNGHIDCFYYHHEWIGKGVGSALMEEILKRAKASHIDQIFAEVSITAKPFFERHGFALIAEQKMVRNGIELTNFKMERNLSQKNGQTE